MRLDREVDGDTGWFDQCRAQAWNNPESVERKTHYRISVDYAAEGLTGPVSLDQGPPGLAVLLGTDCANPSRGTVVATSGLVSGGWHTLTGSWYSGNNDFLPQMLLHLQNVRSGAVFIRSVSLRAELGQGQFGPELMERPLMAYEAYVPEERAYSLDRIIQHAETSGVAT